MCGISFFKNVSKSWWNVFKSFLVKTIGVDTVKDLKKHSLEIEKQKKAMDAEVKNRTEDGGSKVEA